ncbi:MAG: molybdate ABC transporter substrate-binding protein [Lachnospirales bacterium]
MKFLPLLFIIFLTSCGSTEKSITISAAASLKDALTEIETNYEKDNNVELYINFAGSGTLANEILAGAPSDVFFSASKKQMDKLDEAGLVKNSVDLLNNEIVLIEPVDSTENYTFDTLETASKIGIGEPKTVPAGRYGSEVIEYLGKDIEDLLVYGKDVAEVRVWVETSNVDCGIVYKTDAITDKVKITDTAPAESHTPVVYPVGTISDNKYGEEFLEYLQEDAQKEIFKGYGFTIND